VLVSGLEVWCSTAFSGRNVVCWFLGPVALQWLRGLANLGSESETCVGSRVHLVGVSISFEKNFYRLPFTPPLSGSPYQSFIELLSQIVRGDGCAGDLKCEVVQRRLSV
jgi:hypothetical protein